jgi:hypothetical protein
MTKSAYVYDWCDGPLPVPAGKSAYRIKGEFYRHLDVTIRKVDGKSGGALAKAFAREGLDAFQRQPFVSTALYDNLPLPRMVMCIAEVMGKDVGELTTKMGRRAGEAQQKGLYKDLMAEITVAKFDAAFAKVLGFYYDYGALQVTRPDGVDGKAMRVVREGVPLAVAEWWCLVSIPYLQVPLEARGVKGLTAVWKVVPDPTPRPVPLGTATWDLRWTDAPR